LINKAQYTDSGKQMATECEKWLDKNSDV